MNSSAKFYKHSSKNNSQESFISFCEYPRRKPRISDPKAFSVDRDLLILLIGMIRVIQITLSDITFQKFLQIMAIEFSSKYPMNCNRNSYKNSFTMVY